MKMKKLDVTIAEAFNDDDLVMVQGTGGQLAFDNAIENLQEINHELVDMNISKKTQERISAFLQTAVSNAYKAGIVTGANLPEMTQNSFIQLLYGDGGKRETGTFIQNCLTELMFQVR
jgi:hypothetical protein